MLLKHPNADNTESSDEAPLVLGGHEQQEASRKSGAASMWFTLLLSCVSIGWLAAIVLYAERNIGWSNILQMLPHEIGAFLAGAFAPLAFLWLLGAFAKRGLDNKLHANALDALIRELGYPSPEAEARVASLTMTLRRHAREVQSETENAAEKLGSVNTVLGKQHDIAGEMTGKLIEHADHLQGELDRRVKIINELLAKADVQKETLDTIAFTQEEGMQKVLTAAEESSEAMRAALQSQIEALDKAVEDAEQKATRLTHKLEQTSQGIEAVAHRALERAESSSDGLASQIRGLDEASENARQNIDRGSNHLKENAISVENAAKTAVVELEKVGEELRRNTNDLTLSGDNSLERLSSLRDGLKSSTGDVEVAIDTLQNKQSAFKLEAQEVGKEVQHATEQLTEEGKRLTASAEDMAANLGSASENLRSEATSLQQTFNRAEDSLADVSDVLQKGHDLLNAAGDKSLSDADQLKKRMKEHAEELHSNSDIVANRTLEIQEQLRKQINALQIASQQVNDMTLEISARLDENVDNLSKASLETSNQITQIGSGFQRQADALTSVTARVSNEIKEAGEGLKRETQDIEQHGERTSKSIRAASEELEKKQKELISTTDLSKAKLASAVEEAVRHHQDLMASAERATMQAKQSGEAAYSQSAELARTAEKASAELRAMGDQARNHIDDLTTAAEKANREGSSLSTNTKQSIEDISAASSSAKEQLDELAGLSEAARSSAESMEKMLKNETLALTEVARKLADKSEYIESTMAERAQLLQKTSGLANIAGDGFRRKTLELAKASELMLSGLQTADEALAKHKRAIENTRARFHVDLDHISNQMTEAGQHAKELGAEAAQSFKSRASELIQFSDRAHQGSKELAAQFEQQKRRLEITAQQVENSLSETSGILNAESINLREASSKAAEEALISSLKFQKQAERLKTASQMATQQSEEIAAKQQSTSGEAFRKASTLIVDSLHSMSIDLARSMDNTLPEDLWNRYRRGEKSIFTRRLLKGKDTERIKSLYRDNGDFRRYVQQYRAAFNQLLDETEQSEYSQLLFETYASSDVGKVYLLLTDALGGDQ